MYHNINLDTINDAYFSKLHYFIELQNFVLSRASDAPTTEVGPVVTSVLVMIRVSKTA
jgi:hypothetical protein